MSIDASVAVLLKNISQIGPVNGLRFGVISS